MPFPRVLLLQSETQAASFKIWTKFTESIPFDDNRYTKPASVYL